MSSDREGEAEAKAAALEALLEIKKKDPTKRMVLGNSSIQVQPVSQANIPSPQQNGALPGANVQNNVLQRDFAFANPAVTQASSVPRSNMVYHQPMISPELYHTQISPSVSHLYGLVPGAYANASSENIHRILAGGGGVLFPQQASLQAELYQPRLTANVAQGNFAVITLPAQNPTMNMQLSIPSMQDTSKDASSNPLHPKHPHVPDLTPKTLKPGSVQGQETLNEKIHNKPKSQANISNIPIAAAKKPFSPAALLDATSGPSLVKRTESAPSSTAIRSSQVEEALRSKPQRGKKRENLSLSERLELTRTRNREHAKSTRVRKKARFDELCHREMEWHIFMERQQLEQERRQCLQNFMRFRSAAIKANSRLQQPKGTDGSLGALKSQDLGKCLKNDGGAGKDSSDSSTDATVTIANGGGESKVILGRQHIPSTIGQDGRANYDSLDNEDHGGKDKSQDEYHEDTRVAQSNEVESSCTWDAYIHKLEQFAFSVHPSLSECLSWRSDLTGINGLCSVESALAARVSEHYQERGREILALWMEVLDGLDGVALVKDTGLLQFQLVVIHEEACKTRDRAVSLTDCVESKLQGKEPESSVAASGVLRVSFEPESKKMLSLEICSCDTCLWESFGLRSKTSGRVVTRKSVSAWPSVVSLDQHHHETAIKQELSQSLPTENESDTKPS